jgi:UDP-glucuronate 4-epimerase
MIKNKKSVLITGIAGFIGYHVAKQFLNSGYFIVGVDNVNSYYDQQLKLDRLADLGLKININNFNEATKITNLDFYFGDISDIKTWDYLSRYQFECVIHLAAQAGVRYSLENPMSYIKSNIIGFQNVIDFCVSKNNTKLLYASSSSVYGKTNSPPFNELMNTSLPESLYAATKKSNEIVAYSYYKTKNLVSIGLRFFTVYGPWGRPDMAPFIFADSIFNKRIIEIFNKGDQFRDFTYIDDIVSGVLKVYELLNSDRISVADVINIGNGKPVNLMEFISIMEIIMKVPAIKILVDEQLGDVQFTHADITYLKNMTDYNSSYDIEIGLEKFINWYLGYYTNRLVS